MSTPSKTVSAAEAQKNFLQILDDVTEHNVEVLITRDGKPVAMIVRYARLRGPMEGTVKILGDIVEPINHERRSLESLRGSAKILGDIVEPLDEEWGADK